jgi:glucose/arabinose dehydrogenase
VRAPSGILSDLRPPSCDLLFRTLAATLFLVGAACSPGRAQRPADAPHLTDSTFGGRLWVPKGVTVAQFAKVEKGRFLALGPDGAVYVSQPQANQITRLVDADGDGVAEAQSVAVSGLNMPHGMAFRGDWLYVANTDGVVRVQIADGKAAGAPQQVAAYSARGGHWTRTVVFGRDSAMYVSIGSTCNVCVERTPDRAAVMRYVLTGATGRVDGTLYSSGLRNAVGMAVHPQTGELWVTQNERDNIAPDHQDMPPEEINILRDGADFGWPYCHSDRIPNPEFNDAARCARTVGPALAMQAHSAPLGITFLDRATRLPADVRGDALIALHGSWNRDRPTGAKVVRVRIENGQPVGVEDFIVGWQNDRGQRWGRPVDVLVHTDGSVLVSDDAGGTIYRVWAGQ